MTNLLGVKDEHVINEFCQLHKVSRQQLATSLGLSLSAIDQLENCTLSRITRQLRDELLKSWPQKAPNNALQAAINAFPIQHRPTLAKATASLLNRIFSAYEFVPIDDLVNALNNIAKTMLDKPPTDDKHKTTGTVEAATTKRT